MNQTQLQQKFKARAVKAEAELNRLRSINPKSPLVNDFGRCYDDTKSNMENFVNGKHDARAQQDQQLDMKRLAMDATAHRKNHKYMAQYNYLLGLYNTANSIRFNKVNQKVTGRKPKQNVATRPAAKNANHSAGYVLNKNFMHGAAHARSLSATNAKSMIADNASTTAAPSASMASAGHSMSNTASQGVAHNRTSYQYYKAHKAPRHNNSISTAPAAKDGMHELYLHHATLNQTLSHKYNRPFVNADIRYRSDLNPLAPHAGQHVSNWNVGNAHRTQHNQILSGNSFNNIRRDNHKNPMTFTEMRQRARQGEPLATPMDNMAFRAKTIVVKQAKALGRGIKHLGTRAYRAIDQSSIVRTSKPFQWGKEIKAHIKGMHIKEHIHAYAFRFKKLSLQRGEAANRRYGHEADAMQAAGVGDNSSNNRYSALPQNGYNQGHSFNAGDDGPDL